MIRSSVFQVGQSLIFCGTVCVSSTFVCVCTICANRSLEYSLNDNYVISFGHSFAILYSSETKPVSLLHDG